MQAVFAKYQQTTQLLAQQRENATLTFLWCSLKPDRASQKVKSMPTTTFHFLFIVRLLPGCIAAQVPVHLTHAAVWRVTAKFKALRRSRPRRRRCVRFLYASKSLHFAATEEKTQSW